tara:strand:- start:75 stop:527 length:453 start_codon:yes stop_codon:yes gene_type:complete
MEQFKYGPLVYNTVESDDDSGNYYWPGNGMPPVGYDEYNIPIDSKGFQCLDAQQCPLHPHYEVIDDVVKGGKAMEYNDALGCNIPTLDHFNGWFENTFIKVEPRNLAFFVLRWINFQPDDHPATSALYEKYAQLDIEDIINAVWPSLKAD